MEEKDIMKEEPTAQPSAPEEMPPVEEPTSEVVETKEKETTTALREAYEDAVEEKPKKRRKLKKWQIITICVAAVLVLAILGVVLFFVLDSAFAPKPVDGLEVKFENARPAYELTYTEGELALINSAMTDGASEDTIKEAIAMMYQKANYNKIHADQAVAVSRGEGSATLDLGPIIGKPSGTMIVRAFKAQAGNEFYYQKAAKITKGELNGSPLGTKILNILKGKLDQQERSYTNGTDKMYLTGTLKGRKAAIDYDTPEQEVIPFLTVGIPNEINTYTQKENYYKDGNYLDDPREITNFKIIKDYVVLKPMSEYLKSEMTSELIGGENYIEYNEEGKYYTCCFSLLIEGEGHDDCVNISRGYLRESANSDDLEYKKFDVVLQIWDNGYLKMMHDEEIWSGHYDNGSMTTESNSWYESIMYYNFSDKLFSEEDAIAYEGDEWAKKFIAHYSAEMEGIKNKQSK